MIAVSLWPSQLATQVAVLVAHNSSFRSIQHEYFYCSLGCWQVEPNFVLRPVEQSIEEMPALESID